RFFCEEDKTASFTHRKLRQLWRDMGIVAEDNRMLRELTLDDIVLIGLVVGAMIAVIDEQIDAVRERPHRLYGVAIEDLADRRIGWLQIEAGVRIDVRSKVTTRMTFCRIPQQCCAQHNGAHALIDARLDDHLRLQGSSDRVPDHPASDMRMPIGSESF